MAAAVAALAVVVKLAASDCEVKVQGFDDRSAVAAS